MTSKAEYLAWKRSTDMGCVFARLIAGQPDQYQFGQRLEVVDGDQVSKVAAKTEKLVGSWVADTGIAAATLLFPGLPQLPALAQFALELGKQPGWVAAPKPILQTPDGPVVPFSVTREVPRVDGVIVPSEALMFGPFAEFPKTRRSPVVAMELFVGLIVPRFRGHRDYAALPRTNLFNSNSIGLT